MCYSAKILADFRAYQRFGGTLDMPAFARLAGWAAEAGTWMSAVPKAMRNAFLASSLPEDEDARNAALEAYRVAALAQELDRRADRSPAPGLRNTYFAAFSRRPCPYARK